MRLKQCPRVAPWTVWLLVISLSLLPPVLYALWLRAREKHGRNPLRVVFGALFFGGTVGVGVAVILHYLFNVAFAAPGADFALDAHFISVVIAAPIVEEFSKGMGFVFLKPHVMEIEDGIIFGGAIGLGFAATENLLYAIDALNQHNAEFAIWTVVLRIFSSMLLHTATTALLGFGFSSVITRNGVAAMVLPFYVVAVALHALYNFLVTQGSVFALFAALVMVVIVLTVLQRKVEVLDALPHDQKH